MKKVWFRNSRGQKLAGVLHEADSDKAVILLHGFSADKDERGIFIRAAEALSKSGFTALRFDFAGSGESGGKFEEMSFNSEVSDLKSAIKLMKSKGYKKIGLVGASFGGSVSILGCSNGVKTIVLWNPLLRIETFEDYLSTQNKNWREDFRAKGFFEFYKENKRRFFRVGKNLVGELDKINILSEARKVKVPVMAANGDKDYITPLSDSKELMKVIKAPKSLEIIKGAEHGFHEPVSEKIAIRLTLEWFRKYL
jgi:alpha-beta hydrolase superfamily lysophospholipase